MSGARRAGRDVGPPVIAPRPAPPAHRIGPFTGAIPVVKPGDVKPAEVNPAEAKPVLPSSPVPGVSTPGASAVGKSAVKPVAAAEEQKPRRRRRRRGGASRMPDRAIVFVGPMAAGKTSLGRRVAKDLGIPFVDSDQLFVREYGAVADFFTSHGEEEFRRIEAQIIADSLAEQGAKVVALGGGAVLTESTRVLLGNYPTVLLMTTQEAVLRRANLSRRPLLRNDPSAWGRILGERKHLYREVADVTFRTDRASQEQLTKNVVQWVRAFARREHATSLREDNPSSEEE